MASEDGDVWSPRDGVGLLRVETGVGLAVAVTLYVGLTGVVDGGAKHILAVVAGLLVTYGIRWYRAGQGTGGSPS